MELLFQNQKIQFDQQPSVDFIIEKINSLLGTSFYLSHLVADSINVYDDPEQYLLENLETIQTLEVVAQTTEELLNDILLTAENYLKRAVAEFVNLTNAFYNIPTPENWTNFSDLLEGMQWINQIISTIDQMKRKPINWEQYIKLSAKLEVELKNMEEAVINSDHVLIADIIQYELLPIYETLQQEIKTTIDTEGIRHDVN